MHSRTTRTLTAILFSVFVVVSASAAPEGRNESRDWLGRQIDRIVQQLKKVFPPSPFDDTTPIPPKP